MVSPIPGSDTPNKQFCTCDIENSTDGSVLDVFTCARVNGDLCHYVFPGWAEWFEWIKVQGCFDPTFRTIYAHNGGRWDWLSFIHHLISVGYRNPDMSIVHDGPNVIMMTLKIEGKKFCFVDSINLLRSSLETLGQYMLGRGKSDTEGVLPHILKKRNPQKYYAYGRNDCELLLLILEKTLDIIRKEICPIKKLGVTIGSTAMKVFQTIGGFAPIKCPEDEEQKLFFRESFAGGRVEVFNYGRCENVRIYDVNSLYPYSMLLPLPVSDRFLLDNNPSISSGIPRGIYRVIFTQKRRDIPAVLTWGGKGVYSGEGVYCFPELELLKQVDRNCEINFVKGFRFMDMGCPFETFVRKLYALKSRKDNPPLSLIAKYLLNSCYGKWSQKAEKEVMISLGNMPMADWIRENQIMEDKKPHPKHIEFDMLNEALNCGTITKDIFVPHEHVALASCITSRARAILYLYLIKSLKDGRLLYCDTDSIHTTGRILDRDCSDDIGALKLEACGVGVYVGKKLYAIKTKEGAEKKVAKGVSLGKFSSGIDFDDFEGLARGGTKSVSFSQPATLKEVMAGKMPCILGPKNRTRTLRKT